jgi:hypothetical protein
MLAVLLLLLTALFPLLCYLALKGIVRLDAGKRVYSPLATELNDATAAFEAFVREKVAPTNPGLAAEMLREATRNRQALAALSGGGTLAYFFGRPRREGALEERVRSASSRYDALIRAASETGAPEVD